MTLPKPSKAEVAAARAKLRPGERLSYYVKIEDHSYGNKLSSDCRWWTTVEWYFPHCASCPAQAKAAAVAAKKHGLKVVWQEGLQPEWDYSNDP